MFSGAIHFQQCLFARTFRRVRVPNLPPTPVELSVQLPVEMFARTFIKTHVKAMVHILLPMYPLTFTKMSVPIFTFTAR